jgi:hypothetical protein
VSRRVLSSAAALVAVLVATVLALTTPGSAKPHPPYRISITSTATTVTAGEQVGFSGSVRPVTDAMRKQDVKLQITYPDGLFETAGLDRPTRKGAYSFTQSFKTPGTYLVRARIAAGKGHSQGISKELTITVVPLSVP